MAQSAFVSANDTMSDETTTKSLNDIIAGTVENDDMSLSSSPPPGKKRKRDNISDSSDESSNDGDSSDESSSSDSSNSESSSENESHDDTSSFRHKRKTVARDTIDDGDDDGGDHRVRDRNHRQQQQEKDEKKELENSENAEEENEEGELREDTETIDETKSSCDLKNDELLDAHSQLSPSSLYVPTSIEKLRENARAIDKYRRGVSTAVAATASSLDDDDCQQQQQQQRTMVKRQLLHGGGGGGHGGDGYDVKNDNRDYNDDVYNERSTAASRPIVRNRQELRSFGANKLYNKLDYLLKYIFETMSQEDLFYFRRNILSKLSYWYYEFNNLMRRNDRSQPQRPVLIRPGQSYNRISSVEMSGNAADGDNNDGGIASFARPTTYVDSSLSSIDAVRPVAAITQHQQFDRFDGSGGGGSGIYDPTTVAAINSPILQSPQLSSSTATILTVNFAPNCPSSSYYYNSDCYYNTNDGGGNDGGGNGYSDGIHIIGKQQYDYAAATPYYDTIPTTQRGGRGEEGQLPAGQNMYSNRYNVYDHQSTR